MLRRPSLVWWKPVGTRQLAESASPGSLLTILGQPFPVLADEQILAIGPDRNQSTVFLSC